MADNYALYAVNSAIPYANVPQPNLATWGRIERGTFADGTARFALGKAVEWTFDGAISAAQFQALALARPTNGKVEVQTWKGPEGGVAGSFVVCTAVMGEPQGLARDGEYVGVAVKFTQVIAL